jgi:hypothetical protein
MVRNYADRPVPRESLERIAAAGRLAVSVETGAGMVRVDVGWGSIEKDGKGRYDSWYLSKVDAVLARAEARGLKVLFTFWRTPCWASEAPETIKQGCTGRWWERDVEIYPPVNSADYGDALAYMVRRYGSRVAAWEIW